MVFAPSISLAIDDIGVKKEIFTPQDILIEGIRKVEKEAILEKISLKKNTPITNYMLKRSLQQIYAMKYFDSVEAHQEKVKGKNVLVFKLQEKPIIASIKFEGNDEVSNDDLKEVLKTKEFSILDVNSIQADIKALGKTYEEKGFYLAQIQYRVDDAKGDNVNLVFVVKEFEKVRVKKVTFLGNGLL